MRAVASGVLAVLAALAVVAEAQPAADLERARELYRTAEAAMKEARYDDAIRDYGAAYDLAKDPAFFYKLGSAHERAGKCGDALVYYRRYLREGKPSEEFAKLTGARIAACGGDPARVEPPPGDGKAPADAQPSDSKPPAEPKPPAAPKPPTDAKPPGPAVPGAGAAAEPEPAPASALPPRAADAAAGPLDPSGPVPSGRYRGPWLLVGGSLALVTVGAVFAYSADAAERDVDDLYVGLNGNPPPFNDTTRRLYDDAIAEGRRYQTLSIASFSLAGAMAVGAALWYALDRGERSAPVVTPTIAPGAAGVSTTLRF